MSTEINSNVLEWLYERELDSREVEYVAYVKYDGVKLAKISSHDVDDLAYQLHKLTDAVDKQTEENAQVDFYDGNFYEPDGDDMAKEDRL